jgi:hypothetical protein
MYRERSVADNAAHMAAMVTAVHEIMPMPVAIVFDTVSGTIGWPGLTKPWDSFATGNQCTSYQKQHKVHASIIAKGMLSDNQTKRPFAACEHVDQLCLPA